jgi:DNA-binding transcriptional LysR family regulator
MELRLVRAFVEVARQGSAARAAHVLGRSQPSLSMALKALQEDLGVRLFERSGRRNQLTPEGRALLERAGPLLEQWQALPGQIQQAARAALSGPVRVGAGEGAVLYLLPGAIRAFRRRHGEAEIIVRNQATEDTIAMLRAGELDFGLRSLAATPAGMIYAPTLSFPRVVIARKGHPILRTRKITLESLARYPFVMPWPRSTTRRLVEHALEKQGLPCRIALEAGGWEIVKRYVGLGLGLAVVPGFCAEARDGSRLGRRSVTHLFGQDDYGIVVKRGRPLSPTALELVRLVDPRFRAESRQEVSA